MKLSIRTNKTIVEGILSRVSVGQNEYVKYEPGNGKQYRLLLANIDGAWLAEASNGWVITDMNSMRSIVVTDNGILLHYNYVAEKLKCSLSDAVCLAEIIGHCTGREFISCEELSEGQKQKKIRRYYADIEGDDWCVFDTSINPHKAVSSWSDKQDAEDDADRRNEGV